MNKKPRLLKKVYYLPKETDFKDRAALKDILKDLLDKHQQLQEYYRKNQEYYLGIADIFDKQTKEGRPNNKIAVNFPKYVVDMENGYFAGKAISYNITLEETKEKLQEVLNDFIFTNEVNSIDFRHGKNCSIYGHSFEMQSIDEDGIYRITKIDPANTIMVYDDSIEESRLCSIYYNIKSVKGKDVCEGTIYTRKTEIDFTKNGNSIIFTNEKDNVYEKVRVIEFKQNENRTGVFDDIISLVDAFNKALSEKANEGEYFDQSYLKVIGLKMEYIEKGVNDEGEPIDITKYGLSPDMLKSRTFYAPDAGENGYDIEFMEKPSADATQEHLLERLKDMIFAISGVPNMTDVNFGTSSGVAIKYRTIALENIRAEKEMEFRSALRQRFKFFFEWHSKKHGQTVPVNAIDFMFYKNLPEDIKSEIEAVKVGAGLLSDETLLSKVSFIKDPKSEIEKRDAERKAPDTYPGLGGNIDGKQRDTD